MIEYKLLPVIRSVLPASFTSDVLIVLIRGLSVFIVRIKKTAEAVKALHTQNQGDNKKATRLKVAYE
jgi:hypothetical protein